MSFLNEQSEPTLYYDRYICLVHNCLFYNSLNDLSLFQSIDEAEKPPSEAATLLQNTTKNRYPNVLACKCCNRGPLVLFFDKFYVKVEVSVIFSRRVYQIDLML